MTVAGRRGRDTGLAVQEDVSVHIFDHATGGTGDHQWVHMDERRGDDLRRVRDHVPGARPGQLRDDVNRAGGEIVGRPVFARLADVPGPIDMVEIFRNSAAAGPIVDEALALDPKPRVIWMQLSVRDDAAAARAEAAGLQVVMNRCPKIEYGRLSGEIGWQGVNSRILSAKKPQLSGKGFQKLTIDRR